jgi:hypothetical protein
VRAFAVTSFAVFAPRAFDTPRERGLD